VLYVFVALLLAPQNVPVPTPAPSPLKEIAHTRSSPFCTTMRDSVGVAVAGVLVNYQVIAQSKPTLLMLGREFVMNHDRSRWAEFDRIRLEDIAGSLAKNLATIDKVLSDPRFVSYPQTTDDKALSDMKARLQAVADEQKQALNLISGVAETYAAEDVNSRSSGLNGAVPKQMDINTGGNGANAGFFNQTMVQFQNNVAQQTSRGPQGAQNVTSISGDPRFTITTSDLANNPFGRLFAAITIGQMQTEELESAAAGAILPSVPSCR
jgi:hypothetical protein